MDYKNRRIEKTAAKEMKFWKCCNCKEQNIPDDEVMKHLEKKHTVAKGKIDFLLDGSMSG